MSKISNTAAERAASGRARADGSGARWQVMPITGATNRTAGKIGGRKTPIIGAGIGAATLNTMIATAGCKKSGTPGAGQSVLQKWTR